MRRRAGLDRRVTEPEVVLDARAQLAEAPLWDDVTGTLLWVDILGHEVHRLDPGTGNDSVLSLPGPVGVAVPRRAGGLVVAVGMTFALLNEETAELTELARVHRGDRMNDGGCDPQGRFWAGTMTDAQTTGASALYAMEPGGDLLEVLGDVTLSNGLAWNPAGDTVYYVDTPLCRVDAFDYDADTAALSGRRTVVDLRDEQGRPDGLTVDADGRLWVAMARAGAVRCYRPDGRLEHVVVVPAPLVTSCAFGGPSLSELYVTTGRWSMTAAQLRDHPHAGALFRVAGLGVQGMPSHRFGS